MLKDIIRIKDLDDDTVSLEAPVGRNDAAVVVIGVIQGASGSWAALDAACACEIACGLLSAAGIDLMSAARKVVEAEKTATAYQSGAIQALASELAKLDGVRT